MTGTAARPVIRCACASCLALDERWPDDGWQMMLFAGVDRAPEAAAIAGEIEIEAEPDDDEAAPDLFSLAD